MERPPFYAAWQEKKLPAIYMTASGNSGNAASRVEAFIQSKGAYATAATPISTRCSKSRPANATPKSARRCSTGSSN